MMKKPLSNYYAFDIIEMIFGLVSFLGTILSFYSLYPASKVQFGNTSGKIIFILSVIIIGGTFVFIFTKMLKFKSQSSSHLHLFSEKAHSICHEMRDLYFELFDKWKKQKDGENAFSLLEKKTQAAEIGCNLLSRAIHEASGSNISACVKIFSSKKVDEHINLIGHRKDLEFAIKKIDIELETAAIYKNGNKQNQIPGKVQLCNHTIYQQAIIDSMSNGSGAFFASSTKKHIIRTLQNAGVNSEFHNPKGNYKLDTKCKDVMCVDIRPTQNWFDVQKSIIAIPISNEHYLRNDFKNTRILGIIKITSDSSGVFKDGGDLHAYIELAKAFADAMYKCFERIDFYNDGGKG